MDTTAATTPTELPGNTWRCPNCGDPRRGGDVSFTWCLNGDCARKEPATA